MAETQKAEPEPKPESKPARPAGGSQPLIHRVCISCNNMFTVTFDQYDAKHCPNCHKAA